MHAFNCTAEYRLGVLFGFTFLRHALLGSHLSINDQYLPIAQQLADLRPINQ